MSAEILWDLFQTGGYAALRERAPASAFEACYLAVLAFGHLDFERAAWHMQRAVQLEPDHLVYSPALRYLQRVAHEGKQQVYTSPEAFTAFIRGGGNIPLYQAVSAALQQVYLRYERMRLLDIGVGDGLALVPALTGSVADVTLVEPSAALLAETQARLDERGVRYQAYAEPLQAFVGHARGDWDVTQATFSLQSIPHDQRSALLLWLREHSRRLLIVEFDVPPFAQVYAPAYVHSVIQRFTAGLAEYDEDRELVAQGFMIPIMFGFFDQTAERINFEQPLAAWKAQLQAAGFEQLETRVLYGYWWAPAFLLDARPPAARPA
jgi:hypothetical protein